MGIDSTGVIVEDTNKVKNKSKKKKKKILKMNEVVTSEDELKMRTEAMIIKQTEDKKESHDSRGRKSVVDRIKARFADAFSKKEKIDFSENVQPP